MQSTKGENVTNVLYPMPRMFGHLSLAFPLQMTGTWNCYTVHLTYDVYYLFFVGGLLMTVLTASVDSHNGSIVCF